MGFDRQETLKKLTESSFEDPQDVFIYILRRENCKFKDLFTGIGNPQCHERELKTEYRALASEVCKEHNTVVTIPVQDSKQVLGIQITPLFGILQVTLRLLTLTQHLVLTRLTCY